MRPHPLKNKTQVEKIIKENLAKFPRVHGDESEEANAELYEKINRDVLDELSAVLDKIIPTWGSKDKHKENTFFGGAREDGTYVPWGIRLEEEIEAFAGGGNKNFKTTTKSGTVTYHQPQIVVKIEPEWLHKKLKWNHGCLDKVKDWKDVYQKTPFIIPSGRGGHANQTCFTLLNIANKAIAKDPKVLDHILNSRFELIEDQDLLNALNKFVDQLNNKDFTNKDPEWKSKLKPIWKEIRVIIFMEFMQTLIRLHKEKTPIKVIPIGFTIQYEDKEADPNFDKKDLFLKPKSRFFKRQQNEQNHQKFVDKVKNVMQDFVNKIQGDTNEMA